jgi:hypothetical protein
LYLCRNDLEYSKKDSAKIINVYRNFGENAFDRTEKLKKEYD